MNFKQIAAYFLILPATLHVFGFVLLILTPKEKLGFSNKLYYINLSVAEIFTCWLGVIKRLLSGNSAIIAIYFHYTVGFVSLFLTMTVLTIDRFFMVYLNIKYPLYWNNKKTVVLSLSIWFLVFFLGFIFVVTEINRIHLDIYMLPFFDVLFIVVSTVTYIYIFDKIQTNRRSIRTTSVDQTNGNVTVTHKGKEFLSIFLLVISFMLFTVIPDLVYLYHFAKDIKVIGTWKEIMLTFMYGTSYTIDFFIYILFSKPVRKTLHGVLKKICDVPF